jgi:tight adherence protein B
MNPTTIVIIGMIGLGGGLLLMLYFEEAGKRRLASRARGRRQISTARASRSASGPQLRRDSQGGFDGFIHRLVPKPEVLRARLAATGTGLTIGTYGLASLILPVVVVGLMLLRGVAPLVSILGGVLVGLWVPHAVVGFLVGGRQKKFIKLFPDAIGLMVRGLKAGLPVSETLVVVGREVSDPVGEEFRRIADQIKLGQAIEDAMWATAKRLNLAEFNFMVITFSVQRETGGNLAETLENLDDILRKRQQMKLKIKAMSSEAIASAGIIGSLPFAMAGIMFVISREYILTLFQSQLGYIMLAGGGGMLLMGIFVMMKMVSFDI